MGCWVTTLSKEDPFSTGAEIFGKWNANTYTVLKVLGEGANGKVFLVKSTKDYYALKLGRDSLDLQSEVNALRALSKKSQEYRKYLMDVDDVEVNGGKRPFYVMKYVQGIDIFEFIRTRGQDWIYVVGRNLLTKLARLHEQGWIFGDLKSENVLVSGYGQVNLVDFGGVTAKGRSVKQFTEVYDRGYWNAGARTADEAYDLFSLAVLFVQALDSEGVFRSKVEILPQHRDRQYLLDRAEKHIKDERMLALLQSCLEGSFQSSKEACADWNKLLVKASRSRSGSSSLTGWLKIGFAVSLMSLVTVIVYLWR